jgi:prepilin-type N-terminal cleavage/methylation domain-containing protein
MSEQPGDAPLAGGPALASLFGRRLGASRLTGFTLVELTVVMVIVGLLFGTLVLPFSALVDQRNYNETQQQIRDVREALIGFAVINGRLPRPATSSTDGAENPTLCKGSDAACTGFIPWTTLGVKKSDAWNKLIRYSVTPAYADGAFTLDTIGSKKVQTRDSSGTVSYLVGAAGACSSTSPCAPAVIHSFGKNHWGTTEEGTALPGGLVSNVDEGLNAIASAVFLSRIQSAVPVGGDFDDIVVWVPPSILMNRMVTAGKLP